METSARSGWAALVVDLPGSLEDEMAGILGEGSLGVEVVPMASGRSHLKVYAASPAEAADLLERVAERLRPFGLTPEQCGACLVALDDGRWAERYQEALQPFPVGERFVVVPHRRPHQEPGRVSILLVPSGAFGTGEHPTTRLCIEALERHARPGSRWLDLGSGTGILSVVAVHCGAALVEARDLDADAVKVARDVLVANRVQDRVHLAVGSADGLAGADLDGAVSNIASSYFLSNTGEVSSTLGPGGILLAAGFLRDEARDVAEALAREGLRVVDERASGDWALFAARRAPLET